MMDEVVRISFLVLLGVTLGITVAWYLHFCYQEITGTGQLVIDPITVVGDDEKGGDELGKALAQMLQARLESIANEVNSAQVGLQNSASATAPSPEQIGNVRTWTPDVPLKIFILPKLDTGTLNITRMNVTVGGVDVGGIIPWLQRTLSNRRTLHFTIYSQGDETQVFGSLSALRVSGTGVQLPIKGKDGKKPPLDEVIDRLAYEIIRRSLETNPSYKVQPLQPEEFVILAQALVQAGNSNRLSQLGRGGVQGDFAGLLPPITTLSDKIPDWPELGYFAGWIADKGGDSASAVKYYQRIATRIDTSKYPGALEYVQSRIAALNKPTPAPVQVAADLAPAVPVLDLSTHIPFIRDAGDEGSVVGQALATALEFQIQKATHRDYRISARYIYYAAREVAGTTGTDSGATIRDGIRVLATKGAVEEDIWPYVPGQFAAKPPAAVATAKRYRIADARLVKDLDGIKRALAENGPVVTGITVYQSAMSTEAAKTGVIPMPEKGAQMIGGHAIVIVGFDDHKKLFKFANSWGASWGRHGFGYLPYDYLKKDSHDAYTFKLAPS